MNRPYTTLFHISSLDGKLSTGSVDARDTDKDYKRISGIKEGVEQYYDLERKTDRYSFNTGRVMAKIGVNEKTTNPIHCPDVVFILVDNSHLTASGIENLCNNLKELILVTTNSDHPAFKSANTNLRIIFYEGEIDFVDLFRGFKEDMSIDRITIQSGGTINAELLRNGLIDHVSLVIAPCLIGGRDTVSLVDGPSLTTDADLNNIRVLKLVKSEVLKDSFLHLEYDVVPDTQVSM